MLFSFQQHRWVTALAMSVCLLAQAAQPERDVRDIERQDRQVDVAALDSMLMAIRSLNVLLQKRRDSNEEPDVLIKLVELHQKVGLIEFRVAHGRGGGDLSRPKATLKSMIRLIDRLMEKYPSHPYIPKAYLVRGKAYKEIGDLKNAERDFLTLASRYPSHDAATLGMLHLCDLLMETRDYSKAVGYLKQLEAKPNKPYYSIVLDHLGWAHFYMGDIPGAIRYVNTRIVFLSRLKSKTRADLNDLEAAAINATLFYAKAIEKRIDEYTVPKALNYFKSIVPENRLGKIFVRFAQHLRTSGLEPQLEELQKILVQQYAEFPETIEAFFIVFENQVNQRRFAQMKWSLSAYKNLVSKYPEHNKDGALTVKVKGYLTNAATSLQGSLAQKKVDSERLPLIQLLQEVYGYILAFTDKTDKSVAKIHFNMAELNFELKKYKLAEYHYRWVVDNGNPADKVDAVLIPKASSSAIAARYELLREKGIIPKELKARAIDKNTPGTLDPQLVEWLDWLKGLQRFKTTESMEVYFFEGNRAVYAQGHIEDALVRLSLFAERFPKSQYAIPSISLILDTLIASSRWEKAFEVAKRFSESPQVTSPEFKKKLVTIASDVYFKMIENSYKQQDFANSLKMSDDFLKLYPTSAKVGDCLAIAANSALGLKDKRRALVYFARATKSTSSPDVLGPAVLTKASVAEESFEYEGATQELQEYLRKYAKSSGFKPEELNDLRRKAVFFALLSGKKVFMEDALEYPICTKDISEHCQQMDALWSLVHPGSKKDKKERNPLARAGNGYKVNRPIWAAIALEDGANLSLADRMAMAEIIASGWANLPPIAKYTMSPYISVSIPLTIAAARADVKKKAPLDVSKKKIDRRVASIKKLEEVGAKLIELPWVRIKATLLNEMANLYSEFSQELKSIPAPPGLTSKDLAEYKATIHEVIAPFILKTLEYRRQAFALASNNAIEDTQLKPITTARFQEEAAFGRAMRQEWTGERAKAISLSWIEDLASRVPASSEIATSYKHRLHKALKTRNWPAIAYLLQEGKGKDYVPQGTYVLAKSVSLSMAGAQGEGFAELKESASDLSRDQKREVVGVMISQFYHSFSKGGTKFWLDKWSGSDDRTSEEAMKLVTEAEKWAKIEVVEPELTPEAKPESKPESKESKEQKS